MGIGERRKGSERRVDGEGREVGRRGREEEGYAESLRGRYRMEIITDLMTSCT